MALDRGGLRYEIQVIVNGLRDLRRFRTELAATLRNTKKVTQEQVRNAQNLSRLSVATSRARQAQERANKATFDAKRAEAALRRERTAGQQATRRARLDEAKLNSERQRGLLVAARRRRLQQQNTRATRRASQVQSRFNRLLGIGAQQGNRISFQFRRLIGILAVFQAARAAGGLFTGLIREGIQFNAQIEASQLGIAGIITNIVKLRDEMGNVTDESIEFGDALDLAKGQVARLRVDALETVATFTELQRAFQEGLAPGLAAGLDLDQIREVSVLVSQAASALNIPQNQLGEELRSLLSGTGTERTTRVAKAFGLSARALNKLVREAKDGDELFKLITEGLKGTAQAARLAANSFIGLKARAQDALGFLSGVAGEGLFTELGQQIRDFVSAAKEGTAEGNFIANPELVAVLRTVLDGIKDAIISIRLELDKVSFEDAFGAASSFGEVIRTLGSILGPVIRGLIEGLSEVFQLFSDISSAVGGIDPGALTDVIALTVKWLTVMFVFQTTIGVILGTLKLLGPIVGVVRVALLGVGSVLKTLNVLTFGLLSKFLILPLVIAVIVGGLKLLIDKLAGFSVKFETFVKILQDGFIDLGLLIVASLEFSFGGLIQLIRRTFDAVLANLLRRISIFIFDVGDEVQKLAPAPGASLKEAAAGLGDAAAFFSKGVVKADKELDSLEKKLLKAQDALKFNFEENLREDKDAGSLGDIIQEQVDQARDKIEKSLLGTGLGGLLNSLIFGGDDDAAARDARLKAEAKKAAEIVRKAQEDALKQQGLSGAGVTGASRVSEADEKAIKKAIEQQIKLQAKIDALEKPAREARLIGLQAELQLLVLRKDALFDGRIAVDELTEAERERLKVIEKQIELIGKRQALEKGGAEGGFNKGVQQFIDNADEFDTAARITSSALNGFSTALADALETPQDAGDILLDFFKSLVNQIIQELIRLAIAKAILAAGFGAAEGGPVAGAVDGGPIGLQKGGSVPGTHGRAKGYADGGDIHGPRPKGLDPRDTVPIWAQAGEFMQPVKAVKHYGGQVMEAIRQRMIPAPLLRMLAGGFSPGAMAAGGRTGMGFQTGGQVPARSAATSTSSRIVIESERIVNDGLNSETVRAVAPGIKAPRTLAEIRQS